MNLIFSWVCFTVSLNNSKCSFIPFNLHLDYCSHLGCYIDNVSVAVTSSLPQVFCHFELQVKKLK